MAFSDTADHHLLSTLSGWTLQNSEVEIADAGWDSASATYLKKFATTATADTVAAEWEIGDTLLSSFYLTNARVSPVRGGIWRANVSGKGLISTRPIRVTTGATVTQSNVENVTISGTHYDRAEIKEGTPTVDIEYALSGFDPPLASVGLAGTPDWSPSVRASIWSTIENPLYHFPNGWVLMECTAEQLLDLSLWLVRERWAYVFAWSP